MPRLVKMVGRELVLKYYEFTHPQIEGINLTKFLGGDGVIIRRRGDIVGLKFNSNSAADDIVRNALIGGLVPHLEDMGRPMHKKDVELLLTTHYLLLIRESNLIHKLFGKTKDIIFLISLRQLPPPEYITSTSPENRSFDGVTFYTSGDYSLGILFLTDDAHDFYDDIKSKLKYK